MDEFAPRKMKSVLIISEIIILIIQCIAYKELYMGVYNTVVFVVFELLCLMLLFTRLQTVSAVRSAAAFVLAALALFLLRPAYTVAGAHTIAAEAGAREGFKVISTYGALEDVYSDKYLVSKAYCFCGEDDSGNSMWIYVNPSDGTLKYK